jgi:hypothetical protein
MKRRAILITTILAGALTLMSRLVVLGEDNFTLVDAHKVFIYGFQFHIVDGTAQLSVHTPAWEVPYLLFGNFTVLLLSGLTIAWLFNPLQLRRQNARCGNQAKRSPQS